jgi:hypothetical protein
VSQLETSKYLRNESYAIFWGKVEIDLMVLASQYGKLVVTLKNLNYSESDNFSIDLGTSHGILYDDIVYERFVERGFNPIYTDFVLSPLINVKANSLPLDLRGLGFQLGNVTLEAKLIDLVTHKVVCTQEFDQGIYILVKEVI